MAPFNYIPEELDVFSVPHSRMKELVDGYFEMVQTTNFSNTVDLELLLDSLYRTFAEFKTHEQIENRFIMGKLKSKLATLSIHNTAVCNCHKDNRLIEMMLFIQDGFKKKTAQDRLNYGLKLKKALEEFTNIFLPHMREEEEVFQPMLLEYFSYEELRELKSKVIEQHLLLKQVKQQGLLLPKPPKQPSKEEKCEESTKEDINVCDVVPSGFQDLPPELSLHILSYLTPKDLCRAAQVSKAWSRLTSDPCLWRELYPYKWARGEWTVHDQDTDLNPEEEMFVEDDDYVVIDDDADVDESETSQSEQGSSIVQQVKKEARILHGLIKHVLPKVGQGVRKLDLANSIAITNGQLNKILQACPHLEHLNLSQTRISDTGIKSVGKNGCCSGLKQLVLSGCVNVSDATLVRLAMALTQNSGTMTSSEQCPTDCLCEEYFHVCKRRLGSRCDHSSQHCGNQLPDNDVATQQQMSDHSHTHNGSIKSTESGGDCSPSPRSRKSSTDSTDSVDSSQIDLTCNKPVISHRVSDLVNSKVQKAQAEDPALMQNKTGEENGHNDVISTLEQLYNLASKATNVIGDPVQLTAETRDVDGTSDVINTDDLTSSFETSIIAHQSQYVREPHWPHPTEAVINNISLNETNEVRVSELPADVVRLDSDSLVIGLSDGAKHNDTNCNHDKTELADEKSFLDQDTTNVTYLDAGTCGTRPADVCCSTKTCLSQSVSGMCSGVEGDSHDIGEGNSRLMNPDHDVNSRDNPVVCDSVISEGRTGVGTANNNSRTGIGDSVNSDIRAGIGDSVNSDIRTGIGDSVNSDIRTGFGDIVNSDIRTGIGANVNSDIRTGISDSANSDIRPGIGDSLNSDRRTGIGDSANRDIETDFGDSANRDIETDFGDSVNSDIRTGIGDSVNSDIRTGIGDSVNSDIRTGIGDSGNSDIRTGIGDGVNSDIRTGIGDSVNSDIRTGIGDSANSDIRTGIGDSVNSDIITGIGDGVNSDIRTGIGDSVNSDIRTGIGDGVNSDIRTGFDDSVNSDSRSGFGDSVNTDSRTVVQNLTTLISNSLPDKNAGFTRHNATHCDNGDVTVRANCSEQGITYNLGDRKVGLVNEMKPESSVLVETVSQGRPSTPSDHPSSERRCNRRQNTNSPLLEGAFTQSSPVGGVCEGCTRTVCLKQNVKIQVREANPSRMYPVGQSDFSLCRGKTKPCGGFIETTCNDASGKDCGIHCLGNSCKGIAANDSRQMSAKIGDPNGLHVTGSQQHLENVDMKQTTQKTKHENCFDIAKNFEIDKEIDEEKIDIENSYELSNKPSAKKTGIIEYLDTKIRPMRVGRQKSRDMASSSRERTVRKETAATETGVKSMELAVIDIETAHYKSPITTNMKSSAESYETVAKDHYTEVKRKKKNTFISEGEFPIENQTSSKYVDVEANNAPYEPGQERPNDSRNVEKGDFQSSKSSNSSVELPLFKHVQISSTSDLSATCDINSLVTTSGNEGKVSNRIDTSQKDTRNTSAEAVQFCWLQVGKQDHDTGQQGGQITQSHSSDQLSCHERCGRSLRDMRVNSIEECPGQKTSPVLEETSDTGQPDADRSRTLQHIDLSGCFQVTDMGLRALARCGYFPSMEHLNLSGCFKLTGQGLHDIVRVCPNLDPRNLYYCDNITDGPYPDTASGCLNVGSKLRLCCRGGD